MAALAQFALLGLGAGAIYALLGIGIVSIYRVSGVINLAQGAFAMAGAFWFYTLHVKHGWSTLPAACISIATLMALGGLMSAVLMRRLSGSSALIRLIATVAVMLTVDAAGVLIWGGNATLIPPWLPSGPVHFGGAVVVPGDRLILLAIALGLTAALWAVSRFTRLGVATTAVSENPRAAASLGWSPERVSLYSWILGGGIGAFAGILLAPITGLQVDNLTFLVIPALAVALVAAFESYWVVLLAGVALGIGQSLVGHYVHIGGLADALPFLVIVAVLYLRGKSLPVRGFVGERAAQFGGGQVRPAVAVPALLVAIGLIQFVMSSNLVIAFTQSLAFGIVMLSLILLTGYTGQLSLGQMALAGVGALLAGRLVATTSISFLPSLLLGVAGTCVVGMLFAIPALRTRGATLAVVTLGLGVAVVSLVFNSLSLTGGGSGTLVGGQTLLGIDIDPLAKPRAYGLFTLGCFVVCALVVTNIRRGRLGRSLVALRANERAAAALGINVSAAKIYAFAVSAAIAGLGGIVIAFQQYSIIYESLFGTSQSVLVVAYAVIGGVGYIGGALAAGLFPSGGVGDYALTELTGGFSRWLPLIGGLGLLVTLMLNPNGVASATLESLRRFRRPRRPPPLPPVEAQRVDPVELDVSGLSVRFGATRAVDDVSLRVRPGEVVGLIGPNGAGKTTFIDAVTGYVRPRAGEVRVNGERIDDRAVHRRARAGVSRSFQSLELFEDVTVRENMQAASDDRDALSYLTSIVAPRNRPLPAAAVAAIHEFRLAEHLEQLPPQLSYGQRRLVAVARAVAAGPSVLLLDEPAAGLNSRETDELGELVRRLADGWGIAVLLVEHDMSFVMSVCDRVVVLDFGRKIAEGTPAEIGADPDVIAAYLGSDDDDDPVPDDRDRGTDGVEGADRVGGAPSERAR